MLLKGFLLSQTGMKMSVQCSSRPEVVKDSDIDRIMKSFQAEMKQRYRIPHVIVEKYKDELCFMVEKNFTCMEVVVPRVKFIKPM